MLIPVGRWSRWCDNFATRHGAVEWATDDGALVGTAADGSEVTARLPFSEHYLGAPRLEDFAAAAQPPPEWGLMLVRKGGFAIGLLHGDRLQASKVGRRHVQGRTKAGGQSQQRFARRRENQARTAYAAATDHAVQIWAQPGGGPMKLRVVTGGDRQAVAEVLADPRLREVEAVGEWLAVPDPRRNVLEDAVVRAQSLVLCIDESPATQR